MKRGNHTGNLIIIFQIKFPETLNQEQIKKLKNILQNYFKICKNILLIKLKIIEKLIIKTGWIY